MDKRTNSRTQDSLAREDSGCEDLEANQTDGRRLTPEGTRTRVATRTSSVRFRAMDVNPAAPNMKYRRTRRLHGRFVTARFPFRRSRAADFDRWRVNRRRRRAVALGSRGGSRLECTIDTARTAFGSEASVPRHRRLGRRRSSRANGLCWESSARFPQICPTFQMDNLQRHF
jgi:hypothetical protein